MRGKRSQSKRSLRVHKANPSSLLTARCLYYYIIIIIKKAKSGTCYSAFYTRRTQDQTCFYNLGSGSAADWHELIIGLPQRTMRPSISRVSEQLEPHFAASKRSTAPINHRLDLHSVARKLPLISHSTEGKRLSWPEHAVG